MKKVEHPTVIAIIPARGGSKSILKKNLTIVGGKPLLSYGIKAALASTMVNRVVVSTDDEEIAQVARDCGADVPFMRPEELATDTTPTLPVLRHTLEYLEKEEQYTPDIVVLIEPTTPLVLPEDIDGAIQKMLKTNSNSCVSVCEIQERPEWMYRFHEGKIQPYIEPEENIPGNVWRQQFPQLYKLNGAVYVSKTDVLMKGQKLIDDNATAIIMPRERSHDIDEPIDLKIVNLLLQEKQQQKVASL